MERAAELFDALGDPLLAVDAGWVVTAVNRAAVMFLGGAGAGEAGDGRALLGRELWAACPWLLGTPVERECRRAAAERQSRTVTWYAERDRRWYDVHAWQAGSALVLVWRDVTAQRRAEDALRAMAARSYALAETSRILARARLELGAVLDAAGARMAAMIGDLCIIQILAADGQVLEPVAIHHVQAERAVFAREALGGRRQRVGEGLMGQVLASGEPLVIVDVEAEDDALGARVWSAHLPFLRRYGMRSLAIHPLRASGAPFGVVGVARDAASEPYTPAELAFVAEAATLVSFAADNARLFAEARREREAAERANRMKDDFLSAASHELRTPLFTLQLALESVLRRASRAGEAVPPEWLRERARRAEGQVQRLASLVGELLDVSRLTAGRLHLQLEEVDLGGLVAQVAERFEDQLGASGSTLAIDVVGDVVGDGVGGAAGDKVAGDKVVGRWDRLRLDQVITNLLGNAIKYGAGRPIRIGVEAAGERVLLHVRDGGIGIAPEDQARIFERFERAAGAQAVSGFGLGLWIVREIVTALGGAVRVASAPGAGSTFTVELPRASRAD